MRRGRLVIMAAVIALVATAPARAATLASEAQRGSANVLHYVAAPGESNNLTVAVVKPLVPGGQITIVIRDSGALIQPGGDATTVLAQCVFKGHEADCDPGAGPVQSGVWAELGDGDDRAGERPCGPETACNVSALVDGGPGNDRLSGRGSALIGGPGADDLGGDFAIVQYQYDPRSEGISVSLDDIANDGAPGEGDNVHSATSRVDATNFADTITGATAHFEVQAFDGDDVIHGGPAADTLDAGYGNDQVFTGGGADYVMGYYGDDVITSRDGDAAFRIDCGEGDDTVIADPSDPIWPGCETVDVG